MGGSRTISGNETYVAGAGSSSGGEVLVDNISFQLSPTITKVTDFFPITGTDDVQTSGTNVVLAGDDPILTACPEFRPGTRARGLLAPGVSRPSGARGCPEMAASYWPGRGAGGTLFADDKPEVLLEEKAVNATIHLDELVGDPVFAVRCRAGGTVQSLWGPRQPC